MEDIVETYRKLEEIRIDLGRYQGLISARYNQIEELSSYTSPQGSLMLEIAQVEDYHEGIRRMRTEIEHFEVEWLSNTNSIKMLTKR